LLYLSCAITTWFAAQAYGQGIGGFCCVFFVSAQYRIPCLFV